MNKKAGERVLSIYLFIIYIIVAIGIVSGVLLFYSNLDIRKIEAGILSDKIIDCLVEQGSLKEEVLNEDFDLLSFCSFDFNEDYAVSIELSDSNSLAFLKEIEAGREDFLEFCGLKGKRIPQCNEKQVYVLNNNKGGFLKIVSAVSKIGQNV